MTWKARSSAAIIGLAIVGVLVWSLAPQPVEVETAAVTRGPFRKTVEEDGKTRVRDRYVIAAPLARRLLRITLKTGDAVHQGMLLALIVPRAPALLDVRTEQELTERLGSAEAERLHTIAVVERAQAALQQARADLERSRKLANKGVLALDRLEHDQTEVEIKQKELLATQFDDQAAMHQVEMARAALQRFRQDAQDHGSEQQWEVRSPISGRVLRVIQESEAVVESGTPLLEIAEPAALEVVVDVLTADASAIAPGASVMLDRGGGAPPLEGRVRLIEPAAFTKISALGVEEQRVNVIIDFVSPHDEWRNLGDAYRVDAQITVLSTAVAIKVPTSALFRINRQWAVFTVTQGRAHLRQIRIGARAEREAVVEDGLEPDEQVIVYPSDAVQDGIRVK
ncbi:efflux RND transporter periplasmic adaptor subunit [Candidatus Entotheonella palauensis]|uniref:efflux RND transporter periplasmic adaptor subunit n=1 Tax=Candidatus Entotheonella palauensis TaxID=93172 RepID=UPI000B7D5924|nr:HlyD family efflux transporter periplasmic adaptor subunit [Candidatus Entotheonella palauensis]